MKTLICLLAGLSLSASLSVAHAQPTAPAPGAAAAKTRTATVIGDPKEATAPAAASGPATVNAMAPDFQLADIEGKKFRLSDYKGQVVVLEWFNDGCPYVKKHYESQNMQKLQKTYRDKGVTWLTVISSAPGKQGFVTSKQLAEIDQKWNPVRTATLIDSDGQVGKLYAAKTTPHMYVIDQKQKLVYAGAIDDQPSADKATIAKAKNYVASAIDATMKGQPVQTASTKPYGCSVKYN